MELKYELFEEGQDGQGGASIIAYAHRKLQESWIEE